MSKQGASNNSSLPELSADSINPYIDHALGDRAWGESLGPAVFKKNPEDFIVEELLPIDFSGAGEHFYLQIEKVQQNTRWVAKQIAQALGVKAKTVSYAGLKDRQSISRQWFSVHLPGKVEPDWTKLDAVEGVQLLKVEKHHKKLRIGQLSSNRFHIVLRDFSVEHRLLQERLEKIAQHGVPNYFGLQRFGRSGANLLHARHLFALGGKDNVKIDRTDRGLYLSAARSFLFNVNLAQRVKNGSWRRCVAGDVMMFDQGNSYFVVDQVDDVDATHQRILTQGLSPTGMLWGGGKLESLYDIAELESHIAERYPEFAEGLETWGLEQQRRRLICHISGLVSQWSGADLSLSFSLSSGCFATSVLREFCDITS